MSQKRLAKNIGVMSVAVFLSRILGLVRDQVMSYYFGTTYLNDAFNVAYNIPNLIRRLFGEGALSAAFVPIYNEIGVNKGKKEQFTFAINILSILTLFLTVLTIIGIAAAPLIVKLLYPGLPSNTLILAVKLCRIMFPYLFFIGISSTFIAILNSHDFFFMTGLSSAMLNLGMLATIITPSLLYNYSNEALIEWAGWGVFWGGLLQTIVNFPYLKKIGYSFKILIRFSGQAVSALWKRFVPAMIGIGIREINLVADALMASFLPVGSITALGLGNRLMQLPLGIFGISTGTAVLPMFSRYIQNQQWDDLSNSFKFTTISLAVIMIPITVIIGILGNDFIYVLFQHGVFDTKAALMTYQALLFYSLGLLFFSLNQTITPLFYANKDTKTPVKIAACMVAINVILNFILMQIIQHRGLALSTSITGMINYLVLLHFIKKSIPELTYKGIFKQIITITGISAFLMIPLYLLNGYFSYNNLWQIAIKDICLITLYFVFYIILSSLFHVSYVTELRIKLWKIVVRNT